MYQVLQTAGITHGKGMQSYLCMMAVRLLEMRRILKDTRSIYLHCDPTASHYLKLLMHGIYGQTNFRLVNMRLQQSMGGLFHRGFVTARTDIPRRTDIEAPVPYRQNKHVLFGQQEGRCDGCRSEFPLAGRRPPDQDQPTTRTRNENQEIT